MPDTANLVSVPFQGAATWRIQWRDGMILQPLTVYFENLATIAVRILP